MASDTDSVTFQVHQSANTAAEIVGQVDVINRTVAETLNTNFMSVAIEEIIVPQSLGQSACFNFSDKSYMFTYVGQTAAGFKFADGTLWTKRGDHGPCYVKQRGFVVGAFS